MLPCSFTLFPYLGLAEETRTLLKNGVNGHSREPRCQSWTKGQGWMHHEQGEATAEAARFPTQGTNCLSGTKLQRCMESLTAAFATRDRTAGLCEMKPEPGQQAACHAWGLAFTHRRSLFACRGLPVALWDRGGFYKHDAATVASPSSLPRLGTGGEMLQGAPQARGSSSCHWGSSHTNSPWLSVGMRSAAVHPPLPEISKR